MTTRTKCHTATRTVLLLAGLLALAAAGPAPVPVYKEFGDWVAACDNVRTCTAHATPDANSDAADAQNGVTLTVTRDAGGAAMPSVAVAGEHPGIPTAVSIDGHPVTGPLPWATEGTGDSRVATLSGAPALALLQHMRDGSGMALSLPGSSARISLAGLSATLLLFDDVQGRLDTAAALARPGPQGDASVPPAPSVPVVHAAAAPPPLANGKALAAVIRRAQGAALKAHDCDTDVADISDGDDAQPLTASDAVVLLVCIQGAYQGSSLVFRVPRTAPRDARLVRLPIPPGATKPDRDSDADLVTSAAYDPATAVLSEFAKARGIGDCGALAQWTFDGHAFQPSAYASQDRCGGEPADWPTLFRTRPAG